MLCCSFFLLLQKLKNRLSFLIRLRQHGSSGLIEDHVFGVIDRLISHVGIPYAGFSSLRVFGSDLEAADRVFQAVLVGAKISSLFVNYSERYVKGSNGTIGTFRFGKRNKGIVTSVPDPKTLRRHSADIHLRPLIHVGAYMEPHRSGNHIFAHGAGEASG
jgi:hypothetical protein